MSCRDNTDGMRHGADTNRDENVDNGKNQKGLKNRRGLAATSEPVYYRNANFPPSTEFNRDSFVTFGNTTNNKIIRTSSSQETEEYLTRLGIDVHLKVRPEIIKKSTTESSVTYERRVIIQCLQPPPIPKAGPLIIRQVRPEQPPPPQPIIIHEREHYTASDEPIVFRELPPTKPAIPGEEIRIEYLPPVPVPPPSVVVHRFPASQNVPRDLYIERWCAYSPLAERETIYEPPPPPVEYQRPTYKIIEYDAAPSNVVTKVEKRAIVRENPDNYVARYGASLLDPRTLEQRVRAEDVNEDIKCLCPAQAKVMSDCERIAHYEPRLSYDYPNTMGSSSQSRYFETTPRVEHTKVTTVSDDICSSAVTGTNQYHQERHQSSSEEGDLD